MRAGLACMTLVAWIAASRIVGTGSADDRDIVAALDTRYQAAVQHHDVQVLSEILTEDFVLVTGNGHIFSKADILREAHDTAEVYDRQEDSHQTVRVWQNTAVVTALLRASGTRSGKSFDVQLWFSDTYVRTASGWGYAVGQGLLSLPATP